MNCPEGGLWGGGGGSGAVCRAAETKGRQNEYF